MFYIFLILLISATTLSAAENNPQETIIDDFIEAIQNKTPSFSEVKKYVNNGGRLLAEDKNGVTVLTHLIQQNFDISSFIPTLPTDWKTEVLPNGLTYLCQAIFSKNLASVKGFLEYEAFLGREVVFNGTLYFPLDFAKCCLTLDNNENQKVNFDRAEIVRVIYETHMKLNRRLINALQIYDEANTTWWQDKCIMDNIAMGASPLATDDAGKTALDLAPTPLLKNYLIARCNEFNEKLLEATKNENTNPHFKKTLSLLGARDSAPRKIDDLIEAVKANNFLEVKTAIEAGVSPIIKNKESLSAFRIAIIQGKTEIAKYFLEKCNVNGDLLNSNEELMTAIESRHVEGVKFLLDHGAFLGKKVMLKGFYPLAFAKSEMDKKGKAHDSKAKEIVNLILKKHQELNFQLIEAVQNSNKIEEIKFLLKRGASPLSKNSLGKSVLDIALPQYKDILKKRCEKLDEELIKALVVTQIIRKAPSLHNLILLGACPKNPHAISLAALNNKEELIKVLIENGADIDQKDPTSGLTALHKAIIEKNEKAASIILKYGADPFIKEDKKKQDVLSALSTNQFEHFIFDDMSNIINLSEGMRKILQRAVLLKRTSTGLKAAGVLSALTCLCCAWYESKDSKDKPIVTEEKNSLRKFFAVLKRKKKTVAFALGAAAFFMADRFGIELARKAIFSNP